MVLNVFTQKKLTKFVQKLQILYKYTGLNIHYFSLYHCSSS